MTKELGFHAPGMDTTTLSEAGAPMKVYRPDGSLLTLDDADKTPVVIELYGPDSSFHRAAHTAMRKAQAERGSLGERTDEQKAQDAIADAALYLAMMTKSWNVKLTDGSDAPCDIETAKRFYLAYPSARDQADVFTSRRAGFMKAS